MRHQLPYAGLRSGCGRIASVILILLLYLLEIIKTVIAGLVAHASGRWLAGWQSPSCVYVNVWLLSREVSNAVSV